MLGLAVLEPGVPIPSGPDLGAASLAFSVSAGGLGANANYAAHVHSGSSCDDPGGHLFLEGGDDPWTAVSLPVSLPASGPGAGPGAGSTSNLFYMAGGYSFDSGPLSLSGRTVVLHDAAGAKVACGPVSYSGLPLEAPLAPLGSAGLVVAGASFSVLILALLFFANHWGWLGGKGGGDGEQVLEMLQRPSQDGPSPNV